MEYSHFLKEKYPSLQISSEVKQASQEKLMLAQVVSWIQMGGFAISFFGQPIFNAISMPQPAWAAYLQENKGIAIMCFFFGNSVVSSMVQTGAFEVFLGGELIHSKIESGQLPEVNHLLRIMADRLPASAY
mmetsp:Transcript_21297/g.42958  ORF Transcript_21297/g.42958 Transcript_21297/m.42958 type:complete len:131 (-) Transcript_21297:168-560(-)